MAAPTLSLSVVSPVVVEADLLVLGVQKSESGPRLLSDELAFAAIAATLSQIGATGAADELRRLPAPDGSPTPIALIGLGPVVTADALRSAAS
jgi:leucyl aminopeptidase